MKKTEQPPLHFSDTPVSHSEKETTSQPVTPYLKAILAGSFEYRGKIVPMSDSDKLAAIRYIKQNNRWRNHFFRG